MKFAKVYFDSKQSCKPKDCYVGLPTNANGTLYFIFYWWISFRKFIYRLFTSLHYSRDLEHPNFVFAEGHEWLDTLGLAKYAVQKDVKLYQDLRGRWKALQDSNNTRYFVISIKKFVFAHSLSSTYNIYYQKTICFANLVENIHRPLDFSIIYKG